MIEERKVSFAEGMAKLSKAYLEKKRIEDKDNLSEIVKGKKKRKVKKEFNEFIWISKYKKPNNINFSLQRIDLEECFTIESYSFSSGTTKIRFLLSGINRRRPWILWKEEWKIDEDKFVNLKPIVGLSKSDTKHSEEAILNLFKDYVIRIGYKIKVDYIEDSRLLSEDKILKIIEA